MKIAVILPQDEKMHPYYGGAIARWVAEVYKNRSGEIDFTFFSTPYKDEGAYELPIKGREFLDICIDPFLQFPKNDVITLRGFPWIAWLYFTNQQFKDYDGIHIHNQGRYALWLRKLGYKGKIMLHMGNSMGTFLPDKRRWAEIYQSVNLAIFCSEFLMRDAMTGFEHILDNFAVVYNGVNESKLLPKNRNRYRILFAGRLIPEKGLVEAIRTVAELRKRGLPVTLRVAGSAGFGTSASKVTSYMRVCQKLVEQVNQQYQDTCILLLGYQSQENLIQEMARARLFFSPVSCNEGFGMAIAEAMSLGTPVIASRRGGIPEVVGNCGYLSSINTSETWADVIAPFLEDDVLWEDHSLRAQKHILQNFHWKKISAAYEHTLYERLLR